MSKSKLYQRLERANHELNINSNSRKVEVYPKINEHLKAAIQAKFNQTSKTNTYSDVGTSPTIYLSEIDDYYRETQTRNRFANRAEKLPTFKSKEACDQFLQAMDTMWNNGLLFQDDRVLTENEQKAYTLLTDVLNENIIMVYYGIIFCDRYESTFNQFKEYCKEKLIKPDVILKIAQTRAVDYLIAKSIYFNNHGGLSFNHQAFLKGYATLLKTTGSASQLQENYDNVLGNMKKAIEARQAATSTNNGELSRNEELLSLANSLEESCSTRFLRLLQIGRERVIFSSFFTSEENTNTGQVGARIDKILSEQSNTSMVQSNR